MLVADYPRLPPSYSVQDAAWSTTSIECTDPPRSHDDSDKSEMLLNAACAMALAVHAGDDAYTIGVDLDTVVHGQLDEAQKIEQVLQAMKAITKLHINPRLTIQHGERQNGFTELTPLQIFARGTDSSFSLELKYDSRLMPHMEAEWFLSHVANYRKSLLDASPSEKLAAIPLVPPTELPILDQYASSPPPPDAYPSSCTTLHSFVLNTARNRPDDIALDFAYDEHDRSVQLTFHQLVLLSQAFAAEHILPRIDRKGKPNVVPICIDKSPQMVIVMLAVLLAGEAYLNLETSFPEGRKQGILEELKGQDMLADVAVVQAAAGERETWARWNLVSEVVDPMEHTEALLDRIRLGSAQDELKALERKLANVDWPQPKGSDPAYVIYTSGTTGKPKGICVEHRNVSAFLRNYRGVFGRAPGERVLQFPSYSFDVSVMNIWDTFAHGATLCMTTPAQLMSDLAGTILRLGCTVVDLTPTVSSVLFEHPEARPGGGETLEQAWRRAGFRVRWINTGGEKVEKWIRDAWIQRGVRVVIDYGPTETTVGVISNQSTELSPPTVPIGRPTGSTPVYILSPASLEPVPLGCIGEICVGGPQVTRGYILPHLNEGVFVDAGPVGRIYRTGDLGRFLADGAGSIDCLGRKDGQIKVNGLRIEIGEIEEHLSPKAHSDIVRGVVDKLETDDIPASLVAILDLSPSFRKKHAPSTTSDSTAEVTILPCSASAEFLALVDQAKHQLSASLPQYMVPRYWLPVNRIPTQGMGKTDRKTLRLLAEGHNWRKARAEARKYQANSNGGSVRQKAKDEWHDSARLAWSKVLKIDADEIADDDAFTKLGGDSIGFLKVVGKLREAGHRVSFKDLVDAATLTECAKVVQRVAGSSNSSTRSPARQYAAFSLLPDGTRESVLRELEDEFGLQSSDVADVYPTAPSQDALLAASLDCTHYYAQAVYKLDSTIEVDVLRRALRDMVQRYPVLRSCFAVLDSAGTTCQAVLNSDSQIVKNASEAKVVEADDLEVSVKTWLDEDRKAHVFAWGKLALSFAIFVSRNGQRKLGWSMHHAMSDGWTLELLTADLRALCHGLPLPERPDFSSVVNWWLAEPNAPAETAAFWQAHLDGATPLEWPSTAPLNGQQLSTSTIRAVHWHGDLAGLSRRSAITPAIASRVAIAIALGRHASTKDVTMGIVRSGRDIEVDLAEEIIGPCVSVLPSRIRLDPSTSLLDLAKSEAGEDRRARAHQHVTLSELGKICKLPGGRADLFNILVTYQSLAERDVESPERAGLSWPIRQPPERITMPTSYTMSFEVTPDADDGDKFELACFYDDRIVEARAVEAVLSDVARVLDYLTTAPCTKLEQVKFDSSAVRVADGDGHDGEATNGHEPSKPDHDVDQREVDEIVFRIRPIWSTVLRVEEEEIGPDDTFGSLGGDSIGMMKLSVRLRKVGIEIPVQRLIKLGTMRQQAVWVLSQSK